MALYVYSHNMPSRSGRGQLYLNSVNADGPYHVTQPVWATLQFLACGDVICRSQWPRGQRRASAAARLLGLRVRISSEHGCLLWVLCVIRGLRDRSIPLPEAFYRVWCV